MALAEDSEEYTETVYHFCGTLGELRTQISIVQVGPGAWGPPGVSPWHGVDTAVPGRCRS